MEKVLRMMDAKFCARGNWKVSKDKFVDSFKQGRMIMLDVRSKQETDVLSLKRFGIEIPIYELPDRLSEVPTDKTIATFCSGKTRATLALAYLMSKGFENVVLLDATLADFASLISPGLALRL